MNKRVVHEENQQLIARNACKRLGLDSFPHYLAISIWISTFFLVVQTLARQLAQLSSRAMMERSRQLGRIATITPLIILLVLCSPSQAAADGTSADLPRGLRPRRLQPILQQNEPVWLDSVSDAVVVRPTRVSPASQSKQSKPKPPYVPPRSWGAGGKRLLADSGGAPRRGLRGSNETGRCVCAFDFDNTLRIERDGLEDVPASDASNIVSDCKSRGYGIAIASANGDFDKLRPVLQDKLDGSTFNGDFFKSKAFQIGDSDKSNELRNIADHYDTSSKCVVLFDDGEFNKRYADETGAAWRQVKREYGITWHDYERGRQTLESQCRCQT